MCSRTSRSGGWGEGGGGPEKQEQSGAGAVGRPGRPEAQTPGGQDSQTERPLRARALGTSLHPDPHKRGPLPPQDFRCGQEVDGSRRVPRVERELATACP